MQQLARTGEQSICVSVSPLLQKSFGVKESTVVEGSAIGIPGSKFNRTLIEITLLRHKAVANSLVVNNDAYGHSFSGRKRKLLSVDRGNELVLAGPVLAETEDVNRRGIF